MTTQAILNERKCEVCNEGEADDNSTYHTSEYWGKRGLIAFHHRDKEKLWYKKDSPNDSRFIHPYCLEMEEYNNKKTQDLTMTYDPKYQTVVQTTAECSQCNKSIAIEFVLNKSKLKIEENGHDHFRYIHNRRFDQFGVCLM